MSLIYWENVLVDPAVPFDITFRIVKPEEEEEEDGEDQGYDVDGAGAVTVDRVSAHKLILGLTSPVFRSQLSGRWGHDQGENQVIVVEDVTAPAFKTMINYMYGIPLSYSVEYLTLDKAQELFDVVYAAKKYLIPQLNQEIVALINKTEITTNTVELDKLEKMAKQFSHLEEASRALLFKCSQERENAVKEAKLVSEKETLQAQHQAQMQGGFNQLELGGVAPDLVLQEVEDIMAGPLVGPQILHDRQREVLALNPLVVLEPSSSSDDEGLVINEVPHDAVENNDELILEPMNIAFDEIGELVNDEDNVSLNVNIDVDDVGVEDNLVNMVVNDIPGNNIRDGDGRLNGLLANSGQIGTFR